MRSSSAQGPFACQAPVFMSTVADVKQGAYSSASRLSSYFTSEGPPASFEPVSPPNQTNPFVSIPAAPPTPPPPPPAFANLHGTLHRLCRMRLVLLGGQVADMPLMQMANYTAALQAQVQAVHKHAKNYIERQYALLFPSRAPAHLEAGREAGRCREGEE